MEGQHGAKIQTSKDWEMLTAAGISEVHGFAGSASAGKTAK